MRRFEISISARRGPWPRIPSRPTMLAGAGIVAGALTAPALSVLPLPGLCLLASLGWALRHTWSVGLAWWAAGVACAAASWVVPLRDPPRFEPSRPVTMVVELRGSWRQGTDSLHARGRAVLVRQRQHVDLRPLDVVVFWPREAPAPASPRLRVRGYLEPAARFYNDAEPSDAPTWFFAVESPRLSEAAASDAGGLARVVRSSSRRARDALDVALPPASRGGSPGQSLVGALVLGDPGRLPPESTATMRRLGLAHLTAASGLHVGIVAGFCVLVSGLGPRAARATAPALAVLLFVAILGLRPPLARAAGCLWCALLARAVGRLPPAASVLSLSAVVLVSSDPRVASDLGFQLSYAATAGILALQPLLAGTLRPLPTFLRESVAVSLAAQLATAPLLVARFSVLPVLAPLWNLFFVPWTAVVLLAGGAWGVADALLPTSLSARPLDALAVPFAMLDHVPRVLGAPLPVSMTAAGGAVVAALVAISMVRRGTRWTVSWTAAWLVAAALLGGGRATPRQFEAVFLDVGQGDAVLLRDGRRALLVDGGGLPRGDIATRVLLPALARLGVRAVDVALVTHGDRDHCGGVRELARWMPVRELWVGPTIADAPCGRALVQEHVGPVSVLAAGERRSFGGFQFEVLHAPRAAPSPNDGSVVVAVAGGGRRLLLAADVEAAVERVLVDRAAELASDLLKVAHHGSRSSTSAGFLAAAGPRLAVVQVGRGNVYGHPSATVLARLADAEALVLRTDLDGRIVVSWSAGGPLRLGTARPRRAPDDGAPALFAASR